MQNALNSTTALKLSDYSYQDEQSFIQQLPYNLSPTQSLDARIKQNIKALRVIEQLDGLSLEEMNYSAGELQAAQNDLASYTGFGGMTKLFKESEYKYRNERSEINKLVGDCEYSDLQRGLLDAIFSPNQITQLMWRLIEKTGLFNIDQPLSVLEPSCGSGLFLGNRPDSLLLRGNDSYIAIDKDAISARITNLLYPQVQTFHQGFEQSSVELESQDLVITNVPYGDYSLFDPMQKYQKLTPKIHDYFILKSLDLVRENGLVCVLTATSTLDRQVSTYRQAMAEQAELITAIRMPSGLFSNFGTQFGADILLFQKTSTPKYTDWVDTFTLINPNESDQGKQVTINDVFNTNRGGTIGAFESKYNTRNKVYQAQLPENKDIDNIALQLSRFIESLSISPLNPVDIQNKQQKNQKRKVVKAINQTFHGEEIEGEFCLDENNNICFRQGKSMIPAELSKIAENKITLFLPLRQAAYQVYKANAGQNNDQELINAQAELNRAYNEFVNKCGFINQPINVNLIQQDPASAVIFSLETYDPVKKQGKKTAIFKKRIMARKNEMVEPENAFDALAMTLNELGEVDVDEIASIMDSTNDEVLHELGDRLYYDPEINEYQLKEVYLSGNVRNKIRYLEQINKPEYQGNIAALKDVLPLEVKVGDDIHIAMGSPWVPVEYVNEFIKHLFSASDNETIDVQYNRETAYWDFTTLPYRFKDYEGEYSTTRVRLQRILESSFNNKLVTVYDSVIIDGKETRRKNHDESLLAQEKQSQLEAYYKVWNFDNDHERAKELVRIYNDIYRSHVPFKPTGDHVRFYGLNTEIEPYKHQRNAVFRSLVSDKVVFSHPVGAGKSLSMIASAIENKRLGMIKRAMLVVPNHMLSQMTGEALRAYPQSNILVMGKNDLKNKVTRDRFMARCLTTDFDLLIITQSTFSRIPLSAQYIKRYMKERIGEIMDVYDNCDKPKTLRQLERKKAAVESRFQKLIDQANKDNALNFESLNIDFIAMDEVHYYKNLSLATNLVGVKGISQACSKRAEDYNSKVKYILEKGGKIVESSGTILSNSMQEAYIILNRLSPELLYEMKTETFDQWVKVYGSLSSSLEPDPKGAGYSVTCRMSFNNVPELINSFKSVVDIQDEDSLDINRPEVRVHKMVAKDNPLMKAYYKTLAKRGKNLPRNPGVGDDNTLVLLNDSFISAMDMRLINSKLPEQESSKVVLCADAVSKIYLSTMAEKTTQIIYVDRSAPYTKKKFNLYDALKSALIVRGVAENEIAYIHDAKNDKQKENLFEMIRSGDIRVLIASTSKAGVGTNIQYRLGAVHHVDMPWVSSDITQRNGRAIRSGNTNKIVDIFYYITNASMDEFRMGLLAHKARMIEKLMKTDINDHSQRSYSDNEDESGMYDELISLSAGNPKVKKKSMLDRDVKIMINTKNSIAVKLDRHQYYLSILKEGMTRDRNKIQSLEIVINKTDLSCIHTVPVIDNVNWNTISNENKKKKSKKNKINNDRDLLIFRNDLGQALIERTHVTGTNYDEQVVIARWGEVVELSVQTREFCSRSERILDMRNYLFTVSVNISGRRYVVNSYYGSDKGYVVLNRFMDSFSELEMDLKRCKSQLGHKETEFRSLMKSKPEEWTVDDEKLLQKNQLEIERLTKFILEQENKSTNDDIDETFEEMVHEAIMEKNEQKCFYPQFDFFLDMEAKKKPKMLRGKRQKKQSLEEMGQMALPMA